MIVDNSRITTRELGDDVGISFGSCHAIFTDVLGMKRAAAIFCSKIATFLAKTTSHGHFSGDVGDNLYLLEKVITDNESGVYEYDIETKLQSS